MFRCFMLLLPGLTLNLLLLISIIFVVGIILLVGYISIGKVSDSKATLELQCCLGYLDDHLTRARPTPGTLKLCFQRVNKTIHR